jgi:transcriptional antiterminator RfaH
VRTLRHREAEAQAAIGELNFESYLPHEIHFARRGRRLVRVKAPLFRQYLFCRFDLDRHPWQRLRRVYWIDGIVSANEIPLRVPDRQVEIIRTAEQIGIYDNTVLPRASRVRVLNGPLAGLVGEVRRATPRRRIEILFEILGRETTIRIDRLQLCKI